MSSGGNKTSAKTVMALSVLGGAVAGGVIGVIGLPDYVAALAIGGALTGGAIGAAFFLFSGGGQ